MSMTTDHDGGMHGHAEPECYTLKSVTLSLNITSQNLLDLKEEGKKQDEHQRRQGNGDEHLILRYIRNNAPRDMAWMKRGPS
jgi:hypothetical protein